MTIEGRNHKTSVIELIGNIEISFALFNQIFHNICPSIKTSGSEGCGVTFGRMINVGARFDEKFDNG
jgi:hypothetical protein